LEIRVIVSNTPLFQQLVRFLPNDVNAKELKILGKAIVKYAESLPELRSLKEQLKVVDLARANPDLIALAFSDVDRTTNEISEGFERLLQDPEQRNT